MTFAMTTSECMIIKSILNKHLNSTDLVYVFGSRAKKTHKKYSDLDLAIDASGKKISFSKHTALNSDFEESDLPYKVDVVDLVTVDHELGEIIKKEGKLLNWNN
jgi:predicted nucleotidyltransferase